jgi:hypothetical protein
MPADHKKYKINVHFVEHQVFYTPIYLCKDEKKFDIHFVHDYKDSATDKPSDKVLVKNLFERGDSDPGVIDIYVTGGPHISSYARANPNCKKGEVLLWTTIVDRLPVMLLMSNGHGKRDYAQYSLRNLSEKAPEKIYSPPQDTTLHYFLSQYYDRTSFQKVYFNQNTEDDKKIIEYFKKHNSIFDGKLDPVNFGKISASLHENEGTYGYGLSSDQNLRNFKMISPPMEIIPFTCIFTKKDIWADDSRRECLHEFCKAINLNISKIHRFNRYYHKNKETGKYDIKPLLTAIENFHHKTNEPLSEPELEKLGQLFVGNLKHLVKQRVFAVNLQNDLALKAKGEGVTYDKEIEDILYNWIIKDVVEIEPAISEIEAEMKLKNEYLEKAKLEFKATVANATYSLGHFLKNRFSAIKANLENIIDDADSLQNNRIKLKTIVRSARRDVERGENIGKMLNIISLLRYEDKITVFNQLTDLKKENKAEYINIERPYCLSRGVDSIQSYLSTKGCDILLTGESNIENAEISNINCVENEVFRPRSFFYDEILLELFLNAFNHSIFDVATPKKRNFEIEFNEFETGIVLSNEIQREKYELLKEKLNQNNEDWACLFQSTGLYNYAKILELTKTGDIKAKVRFFENKYYYDVLVKLTGIKNERHE